MHTARDVIDCCGRDLIDVSYFPDEDIVGSCLDQRLSYKAGKLGRGFHAQTENLYILEKHLPYFHLQIIYHNSNSG